MCSVEVRSPCPRPHPRDLLEGCAELGSRPLCSFCPTVPFLSAIWSMCPNTMGITLSHLVTGKCLCSCDHVGDGRRGGSVVASHQQPLDTPLAGRVSAEPGAAHPKPLLSWARGGGEGASGRIKHRRENSLHQDSLPGDSPLTPNSQLLLPEAVSPPSGWRTDGLLPWGRPPPISVSSSEPWLLLLLLTHSSPYPAPPHTPHLPSSCL